MKYINLRQNSRDNGDSKKEIPVNTTSRDDWIRTSGPYVPNVVRYRAALHPELKYFQPKNRITS